MGTVTVKSKGGQLGTVDEKDLQQALSHGFSVADNKEIQDHNDNEEYGTGLNPLIAAGEAAASIPTFGLSRQLENFTGLTTPEAQAKRAEYNPISNVAGTVGGFFVPMAGPVGGLAKGLGKVGQLATEGVAKILGEAPVGAGFLARAARNVPAAAAGAAVEGAGYGLGNAINEDALGDHEALGEHLMSNVGYGALFAGGLGGTLEAGANRFGTSMIKGRSAADMASRAEAAKAQIQQSVDSKLAQEAGAVQAAAEMPILPPEHIAPGATPFKDFPKSIEDIQSNLKTNFPMVPEGLPASGALKTAVDDLPDLQFKPHNLQYESLKDQGTRNFYKTILEGQSEEAKALRAYEGVQKAEAIGKLDNTIEGLNPLSKPTTDVTKAGEEAVELFSKQYQAEKDELKPLFKQFDEIAGDKKVNVLDSIGKLEEHFPEISEIVSGDKNGVLKIQKYAPTMSISKEAYGGIKDLVNAANKKDLTLTELRNLRDSLKDRATFEKAPREAAQLGAIRKSLMDDMEAHISQHAPDLQVRETFKKYAQNEERRSIMESVLGGSISDKASFKKMIKSEDVLNKIFSNSVTVDAAKQILGKDFNKVLSDYLATNREKMTDAVKNGFSSNKYATFLKSKQPELMTAFADNPQGLKRLNSLTDYMRILPDSPSINPSGTAEKLSIMEKIAGVSKALTPMNALEGFAKKFSDKQAAQKQAFTLNEILAGKHLAAAEESAEQMHLANSKIARLERMAENAAYNIASNAKALFEKSAQTFKRSVGLIGSKLVPEPKKPLKKNDDEANIPGHSKVFAQIERYNSDPELFMDHLQKSTASIFDIAPNISQGIQTSAVRATQFLGSKIPHIPPAGPLSKKNNYAYSASDLAQFERYYNAVEDPIGTMADIKNGTITPEVTETLSTVYPKLYDKMKMEIVEQASDYLGKGNEIPYQLKQSISSFLGQPMDEALQPGSVMANQMSFQSAPQPNEVGGSGKALSSLVGVREMDIANKFSVQQNRMDA